MNLPDLIKPVIDVKQKKVKLFPCYVNRASGLGYAVPELEGCLRRGVYERTCWEKKEKVDVRVQFIFDEGHNQEEQVLKDFLEAGVHIIEQQVAFQWKEYQISGHLDGVVLVDGKPVPVEIKSMHPNIYEGVRSFDDFKKKPWTRAYMCQIMLYMLFKDMDHGIFILKNKSSGMLKQINVGLDYELAEACIKAAEKINRHIVDETLPDRIKDREVCRDCPFKLTCHPDVDFGAPIKIADDPEFEARVNRYFELRQDYLEYNKVYDVIKTRAKASVTDKELNLVVGRHHLTGKTDVKGTFRLKIEEVVQDG